MTQVLSLPSFKTIAAGVAGLVLACLMFAAAPQAQAAGLTWEQRQAVVDLLVEFDVEESAISEVADILSRAEVPESMAQREVEPVAVAESAPVAVAPTCPPLKVGQESVSMQDSDGSCSVSTTTGARAMAAAVRHAEVPDVAGMLVAAAAVPWGAAVDALTDLLYGAGVY
jgi:hypothetical protein